MSAAPQAVSCCSAFYEQSWVRQLAEDVFHPGGEALTRRTVQAMQLPAGAALAELGCGTGTSALLLAQEYGLDVSAVDISAANLERARGRAESAGAAIRFEQANAQELPFENDSFDGVLAECTFSLFPDQPGALREIRRVLKPGGHFAITDMATGGPLPDDIAEVLAPWTCLADAVSRKAYIRKFEQELFRVTEVCDESTGLEELILMLKCKLMLLALGESIGPAPIPDFNPATVRHYLNRFGEEVTNGTIRYLRFHLQAP